MAGFYDFTLIAADGGTLNLADLKGKVVMVVNTATECGFTPQYEPLEAMYEKYRSRGLEIIDIPCNQFGAQAPGTDAEIGQFCTMRFHTAFPRMRKAEVNGPGQLPLYVYLKSCKGFEGFGEGAMADILRDILPKIDPGYAANSDIKWNFTKFIIDRSGRVAARFEPTADMAEVEQFIRTLL